MRPRTRVTATILIRPRHSHCSLSNIGQSWVSRRGLHTRTCRISLRRILGQSEEAPFLIMQRKLRKQGFCPAKPTHVIRSDGQDEIGAMTTMSAFFHTDVPTKGFHTLKPTILCSHNHSSGPQALVPPCLFAKIESTQ